MKIQTYDVQTTHAVERLPAFSLATALAWLGHECDGTCPPQVADARAVTWRIYPPLDDGCTGMRALLDVDFLERTWSRDEGVAMLGAVNDCTRRDRIHVQERPDAQRLAVAHMFSWLSDLADR